MKNRILLISLVVVLGLISMRWWLHDDEQARPLVCEQISPGVKHAKQCTAVELNRARNAYSWVVENFPPMSSTSMAGVSSFVEDTGRRKQSKFYARLIRGDVDGACEQMMVYVNRRGQFDPERSKRREHERALCLSKG